MIFEFRWELNEKIELKVLRDGDYFHAIASVEKGSRSLAAEERSRDAKRAAAFSLRSLADAIERNEA